jgi:predicted RNA-binding Zn ribbon-like protein
VRSAGEVLTSPATLASFLTDHRVEPDALSDGTPPTAADLAEVWALRDDVRSILELDSAETTAGRANDLVRRASIGPVLLGTPDGSWRWHVATTPNASLADELAVLIGTGLLGTLQALGHERFRHCGSPACNGMFVDTSRAGRRRYCMPDICGNRINVANHRARRRTSDRSPTPPKSP